MRIGAVRSLLLARCNLSGGGCVLLVEMTMEASDGIGFTHSKPKTTLSFFYDSAQRRFEEQVRAYRHRVYGFAVYFLGRKAEAEDVTQEVLLKLWEHQDALDEDRLLGWLLRVTRNACIDTLRKRKAYRNVVAPAPDDLGHVAGSDAMPDDDAEAADFQQHLRRALDRLSEPYRSIVILREVQDLKYEEISGAMNLPLNTVKVYLHRARKKLRDELSEVLEYETA